MLVLQRQGWVPDRLWWGKSRRGDKLHGRVSDQFSSKLEEGLFKAVVTFGRNVIVLKSLLSVEDRWLCLTLSVLNICFVATQHHRDVLTYSCQISMPVRHFLVSNSRRYTKHCNSALTLYIIATCQSTRFLLTSCIPYAEHNRASVGMGHKRMDLNTQGSYILLKFTSQMTFHGCSFSSANITNQYQFELSSPWAAITMLTSRSVSAPVWLSRTDFREFKWLSQILADRSNFQTLAARTITQGQDPNFQAIP